MIRWPNGSGLFLGHADPFIDSEDALEHQVDLVREQPGLFLAVAHGLQAVL
jgi:hypothetical protein